ncbi:MAG: hypothetical protein WCW13_03460 [archaeon]
MDFKEQFKVIILLIVLIALVGALWQIPQTTVNFATNVLLSIATSAILSGICGQLIEAFSGEIFKKITINIPIWKFHLPITLFAILTIILKIVLFK